MTYPFNQNGMAVEHDAARQAEDRVYREGEPKPRFSRMRAALLRLERCEEELRHAIEDVTRLSAATGLSEQADHLRKVVQSYE